MQADDMEACQKRVSRRQEQRQSKEVMRKIHEIHKMRALRVSKTDSSSLSLGRIGASMPHKQVLPGPPLSRFVELLWYYENTPQPHQKERLMPDGCITLVINLFEDETRLYDPDDMSNVRKFNGCSVSGPHTKCFAIDTDEQTCVIGISFRPAGAVPFLKLPSDELHNQHVGLDELWGRLAKLRERVLAAPTPAEKLRIVEVALLERAAGMPDGHPVVEYAVENFLAQPATSKIAEVANKTGFGSRRFREITGILQVTLRT